MTKEENKKEDKKRSDDIMKEDLKKLEKEKEEYLNGWQRARADFINYKKNEISRITDAKKSEKRKIILEILEVVDNFELAEKNIPPKEKENDYIQGLLKIKDQLISFLEKMNVKSFETIGESFDPNLHEAVAMIDSDKESDTIVDEIRKGYLLDGELLRPARVKVAK